MPDERLRKLERRWKETGSAQDEAAYLLERVRAGEISPLGLECIPFAVLSDVNGNLEALEAVFADMRAQGISVFLFLGDAVGYGPNPRECLDLLRNHATVALQGRLDQRCISGDDTDLNHRAQRMMCWTRALLRPGLLSSPKRRARWEWLTQRPTHYTNERLMAVHRDPRGPVHSALLLDDLLFRPAEREAVLAAFDRLLFVGDNHRPWVIKETGEGLTAQQLGGRLNLSRQEKALVSVGSVGQPRDHDRRACYVTVSAGTVKWRRVEYDVQRTAAKIRKAKGLDNVLAERLLEGI